MATPAVKYMTVEEYLEMEEASEIKHEYFEGEVFAMAGASVPHNRIVRNAMTAIDAFLRGKNCEVFPSDLKINIKTKALFVYPDLSIVCDGLQFFKDRNDVVTNPLVLVEVISPHTERYDRGKKFMLYRQIDSLKEYILISSMEVLAEKFVRQETGSWTMTEYKNPDDLITIEAINYQTTLAELYRDVVFEQKKKNKGLAG